MKDSEQRIKELWTLLVDVFKESYDIQRYRLKTKLTNNIPEIEIVEKPKRNKTQDLKVTYNGKTIIIKNGEGADTLADFVKSVGVDKVFQLQLKTNGTYLVVKDVAGLEGKGLKKIGDYFITTKNGNREKHSLISDIITKTQFNASVEFVDMDDE